MALVDTEGETQANTGGEMGEPHHEGSPADLEKLLDNCPDVAFVRFQWQDLSGVLRARVVPVEHALAIAAGKRSLHVPPIAFQCIVDNTWLPGQDMRGNHWLVPDWTSLRTRRLLDPLYASVMCRVFEHGPGRPGPDWNLCPRNALQRVVVKAAELLQARVLVGLEVEFEVMKASPCGKLVPHSAGLGRFAVSGLRDPCYVHVEEAVQAMLDAGVQVEAFQTEDHRGQFEIALGPLPPVQAVDQLILVHDTLKRVFARHGLVATMSPRPVPLRQQSTGQHTHISIDPPHKEESFLAGLLLRLPQLCAFCLPYDLSYERVRPGYAGDVVAWGTENRSVAIRKIKPGHWELRFVDATANMYLALAAMLSAGMMGCVKGEPLLWHDASSDARSVTGSGVLMPKTIDEAMDLLDGGSEDFEVMMESRVVGHYLRVKKHEASKLRGMDLEESRELLAELF